MFPGQTARDETDQVPRLWSCELTKMMDECGIAVFWKALAWSKRMLTVVKLGKLRRQPHLTSCINGYWPLHGSQPCRTGRCRNRKMLSRSSFNARLPGFGSFEVAYDHSRTFPTKRPTACLLWSTYVSLRLTYVANCFRGIGLDHAKQRE